MVFWGENLAFYIQKNLKKELHETVRVIWSETDLISPKTIT